MPRSFRFDPPEPRPGTLTRSRLLRALLGRWDHRVTAVVGGPGLGKTTLIAQAVAENRLAPRGQDVWIGVEPADGDAAGDTLARDVAIALAGAGPPPGTEIWASAPSATTVSDVVWRKAPTSVCLVFDDVHLVPPASPAAAWLTELVEALPANGHVLFSGRTAAPVPLARLGSHAAMLELGEDELRFTDHELAEFATQRAVAPERLAGTGGWPALAELAASVDGGRAGAYLWEEVLQPMGPERRRILAMLSDLDGADDEMASAVLDRPVELERALDGVPLVSRGADGWRSPHPLWRSASGIALAEPDRSTLRRRAADHLAQRGRFAAAFALASGAQLWDPAAQVLRAACLSGERPTGRQLDHWLAALPRELLDAPEGRLARGLLAVVASPAQADQPLRDAVVACRSVGDVDGELAALALLGRVGWWKQEPALLAEILPRIGELEQTGHPLARALATFGRAVVSDIAGDDDAVLSELGRIEPGTLDPLWWAVATWLRAAVMLGSGDPAGGLAVLDSIPPPGDLAFQRTIDALRLVAWWSLGRVDAVLEALPRVVDDTRAAGQAQNIMLTLSNACLALAHVGEVDRARRHLDEAGAHEARTGAPSVSLALARASLALAEGDESTAARIVEAAAPSGLDRGSDRRTWRHSLSLSYVLAPATRPHWDAADLRGYLAVARDLAVAVVALREAGTTTHLRQLDLPATDLVRALLHHRFAAELAAGLHTVGRPEGAALLDALGRPGRAAARALAGRAGPPAVARPAAAAKALLAAVPAPPGHTLDLGVLGPTVLRRDGAAVTDGDLRRERVRAVLAFLVAHRKTSRRAMTTALWPGLDERSAGNNLRVTLSYMLRLLEPDRGAGEPAYTVRLDGPDIRLVTGDALRVDVDEFDEHMAAATQAEADGTPSLALDHNLAAAALYRGDLYADVPDADWLTIDRERYRSRFVIASTRAAQLLAARRELDRAEAAARSALEVDPWAEQGHAVLVDAALARGDRTGARRALDRGLAALSELGVAPSDHTQRLRRRVRGDA
jgi:LuxR family maltose regulon positive regulatory protein